jgi:hypothetical protein
MKRTEKLPKETITNVANMPSPPVTPPDHKAAHTVTMRIGRSRYEMTLYAEIREISKALQRLSKCRAGRISVLAWGATGPGFKIPAARPTLSISYRKGPVSDRAFVTCPVTKPYWSLFSSRKAFPPEPPPTPEQCLSCQ